MVMEICDRVELNVKEDAGLSTDLVDLHPRPNLVNALSMATASYPGGEALEGFEAPESEELDRSSAQVEGYTISRKVSCEESLPFLSSHGQHTTHFSTTHMGNKAQTSTMSPKAVEDKVSHDSTHCHPPVLPVATTHSQTATVTTKRKAESRNAMVCGVPSNKITKGASGNTTFNIDDLALPAGFISKKK
jgi:hypothetical protein